MKWMGPNGWFRYKKDKLFASAQPGRPGSPKTRSIFICNPKAMEFFMTIDQLRWGSNIPMISQSLVAMVMGTGIPMCHPVIGHGSGIFQEQLTKKLMPQLVRFVTEDQRALQEWNKLTFQAVDFQGKV